MVIFTALLWILTVISFGSVVYAIRLNRRGIKESENYKIRFGSLLMFVIVAWFVRGLILIYGWIL